MIEVSHLSHSYGVTKAVNDISFDVRQGELFGLIGPDGSGKTTVFRILATLIVPDSGIVKINGLSVVEDFRMLRTKIGYMPGRFSLYQDLFEGCTFRVPETLVFPDHSLYKTFGCHVPIYFVSIWYDQCRNSGFIISQISYIAAVIQQSYYTS